MPNFLKIAERLDVAPALTEIAAQPDLAWLRINTDAMGYIPLLTGECERQFITELPQVWRLIDRVLAILAAEHGDRGTLVMPDRPDAAGAGLYAFRRHRRRVRAPLPARARFAAGVLLTAMVRPNGRGPANAAGAATHPFGVQPWRARPHHHLRA